MAIFARKYKSYITLKNLITRALTGAIFVIVLLFGICYHPYSFLITFCLVTGLAIWEFSSLFHSGHQSIPQRILQIIMGIYLFTATFLYTQNMYDKEIFLPYLLFILWIFISELYLKEPDPVGNCGKIILAQLYCAGSFSLLNFFYAESFQISPQQSIPIYIISLFIFIWCNDTGAYLVGSNFGKHRLFERISPLKSWEGFWGGLIFVLIISQIFALYIPIITPLQWAGLALTIVLFGTWGDLAESLLKRSLGLKDSGHILPGHGGILDRFDSVILAIPACYIYIELFISIRN